MAVSLGDNQHCYAHSLYSPFPLLSRAVPENIPRAVGKPPLSTSASPYCPGRQSGLY